jgi:Holliday junction resolvasome RuvABC ATP-dependent DNA helicase subunit
VRNLAGALLDYLEINARARIELQKSGRVQLLFVGPPVSVLEELFDLMTSSGTKDWYLDGIDFPIVVLLVGGSNPPSQPGACRSARSNWDYAVTARHSERASIVLVGPAAWDRQPESIENASDRLGQPTPKTARNFINADPWPNLLARIESLQGLDARPVARAVSHLWRDSRELDQRHREELAWRAADDLLDGKGLAESVGLPSLAPGIPVYAGIRKGRQALVKLAKACAADGFAEVEQRLVEAREERRQREEQENGSTDFLDDESAIPAMFSHFRSTAGSGGAFARSPSLYFRLDPAREPWWSQLTNEVLEDLLAATEVKKPSGKLQLVVATLLHPARDEPLVVVDDVDMSVVERTRDGDQAVESASFFRRSREGNAEWQDVDGGQLLDDEVPEHNKPMMYKAVVPDHRDVRVRVISLDHFACGGHAHVGNALRNPAPARRSRGISPFEQSVVVRQAGIHRVVVFVASEVAKVALKEPETETHVSEVRDHQANFIIHIEESTQKTVSLLDSAGNTVYTWELGFSVEETTRGVVNSQFEDLVLSHLEGERGRLVTARNCQANDLELQAMEAEHGYRGLLAGWHPVGTTAGQVDWETGRVGELHVPNAMDPRPPQARNEPPADYIDARSKVLAYLRGHPEHYICEVELADSEIQQLAEEYVGSYLDWLRVVPEAAAWSDAIAVYVKTRGSSAGVQTVSDEPIVLLLTPLHPLRFTWHVNAQSALKDSLENQCPLAGLLSPHQTPSITALPIWLGEQVDWRPFVAVPTRDKHWSVLANGSYLGNALLEDAFEILRRLGLPPQGVTGGMSVSQAKRALSDVSGMLSAKPTLRIGLVGSPQTEGGSMEGLIDWVEQGFRVAEPAPDESVEDEEVADAAIPARLGPTSVEVFDFREASARPSEVRLANLSEDVGGRLRWFDGAKTGKPPLDLVMFDQVETTTARLRKPEWTAETSSVLGRGAMFRLHVREDQSAGRVIGEARIGRQQYPAHGLEARLVGAIEEYERLAARGNATHLEFSPDRQTLDAWVQSARFLSATSSQVDPAVFIRSSGEHGDYLWDYDLPSSGGADSGAAGYYLIARPRDSMKAAVSRSLAAVVDPPPPADPVLAEISKRGIPVLKRLAAGGTQSKGEVGMLLAVRLLQDAFRDATTGVRLPVVIGDCIHLLLAVDSYQSPLASVRKALGNKESMKRPDLLVFAISYQAKAVKIKVTPLEVKFHTTQQNYELVQAVEQANNLSRLLKTLWVEPPVNSAWDACGRALLARCLDECFRIYGDPRLHHIGSRDWATVHENVLQTVLGAPELSDVVSINSGRLVAFGPVFKETRLASMDGDALQETLLIGADDAKVLVGNEGSLSERASRGVASLLFSHPHCESSPIAKARGNEAPVGLKESGVTPGQEATAQQGAKDAGEPLDTDAIPEKETYSPVAEVADESEAEQADPDSNVAENESTDEEDNASTPSTGIVPAEIRARVREAFEGFIGNERPVRRVAKDLMSGLMSDPPSVRRNYLLVGLPSVGKTEMAKRIARALQLPFIKLDGPGLNTREKLFDLIDGQLGEVRQAQQVGEDAGQPVFRYPPFVVFIDEIHLVAQKVQESLLTLLEATDRTVRLKDRVAEVPDATFIFATTQDSKLDKAFKNRCTEIYLSAYSIAEVAEMVSDQVRRTGINPATWDPEVYPKIARLGRLIPRRAFEVAKELIDELRTTEHPELPLSRHLDLVRDMMEVDENGLGPLDLEYLNVLARADRPLGEDAIATMLGTVDKDKIVEEIEPLLRRLELIVPGMRGREITKLGREYVATHRAAQ